MNKLNKEILIHEYIELNKSPAEIAQKYKCKSYNVIYHLKKHNLYTKQRQPKVDYNKLTKELLHDLYVVKELSKKEICRILNVQNVKPLRKKLKEYGIPIRPAIRKIMWKPHEEISGIYWSSLVNGAKRRGIEFSISVEYAWEIFIKQNKQCALSKIDIRFEKYTYVKADNKKRWNQKQTASLDRIDSSKGYVEDNIQWLHKDINLMKSDLNQEEFIKYCKAVGGRQ